MNSHSNIVTFSRKGAGCGECLHRPACAWSSLGGGSGESNVPEVALRLYHRGDALFRAGEPLDALYLLRSGSTKTTIGSEDGDEQIIGFQVAGDILGLDAIADDVFVSTATVLDTSSVCVLSIQAYRQATCNAGSVENVLLDAMSRCIRRHEHNLLMLGRLSAEQRLSAFLYDQLEAARARGLSGTSLTLTMSRADIAGYLSLAAETVSRVLTRLQSSGVLTIRRNQLEVLDSARLREAAGRARDGEAAQAAVGMLP